MLVDLHVQSGSCITDWRERGRESLWQCSACWNENQLYESCNGAITEHVADDGEVAVFLFIQTDISHINTLHNCSGSHYSSNPECFSCGSQLACERSKKKKKEMPLTCSRPPDEGIMASSYRSRAPCLSSCGRKSCHLMWRGPFGWDRLSITLHCRSSLLLSPVLLAHSTEMQVGDLSRLNPQKSDRPLAL